MTDLAFGRDILGDWERASHLEWLVTNGIGGFASGTLSGALTRRTHGLLFAALAPPRERTLLLAKLAERIELDGQAIELDTNHWASGAVHPEGYRHLESFRLDDTVPVWTWAMGDTRIEKRIWMEHGENTTYVRYHVLAARSPIPLTLHVLANDRGARELRAHGDQASRVEPALGGMCIEFDGGRTPLWLLATGAEFQIHPEWHRGHRLALETEKGREDSEDHLCVGEIHARIGPGESLTVVASTRRDAGLGEAAPLALAGALARRRAHERSVLDAWKRARPAAARMAPDWVRRLVLAADAFLVERTSFEDPNGRTVFAGHPEPGDRARDAMIALPGLTLVTGRPEIARAILTSYAHHVSQGMLPNGLVGDDGAPGFDSADASLWFFQAVRAYHEATADDSFLTLVYPVLEDIGAWYERGTRFGIRVDDDGLVTQGADDMTLTWMDARVDDHVMTPRQGKAVEINALWYNALSAMAGFSRRLKRPPENFEAMAKQVERGFERFWNPDTGCLFDVLDGPDGNDPAIRPNQIFAVSLPDTPLPAAKRRAVVDVCGRYLVTSHGLRTLSPSDPAYAGTCAGDRRTRRAACHQGSSWTWLLPHFALAYARVHRDREAALGYLEPLGGLAVQYGVGWLPGIADGDLPHPPRGPIARAWSVAETLRAWHELAVEKRRLRPQGAVRATAAVTV